MEKKKILLVEDDQFLSTLYKDILTTEGFLIELAVDGEQAYQKIKQGGWDLVLLDIILPKFDGMTVIEKLKTDQPDSLKQKIAFLTNLDQQETIDRIKQLGYGYLVKSELNPDQFVTRVKSLLS